MMNVATMNPTVSPRLSRWRRATLALMVLGYAGYYLCRSNLSVCIPLIARDLAGQGYSQPQAMDRLGTIVSLGVLAYALGKFFAGPVADFAGGRRNFLAGMIGSIGFTVLFAMGGSIPVFTAAAVGNRFIQSFGWAGMIKITSRWFPASTYGTVMAIISLSFLFGDALARKFMGWLIACGLTWRTVFLACAATLLGMLVTSLLWLKESPARIGESEPESGAESLFGEDGTRAVPPSFAQLVLPLLGRGIFWQVCGLSLGLTLLRETFNTWTPTYFTQALGLTPAQAADRSALFPLFGGISVILVGVLSDRLGRVGRAAIMSVCLALATFALGILALRDFAGSTIQPVALVTLIGFLLIGPYSFLAGAISLDFGGKQGSSTASAIIDGVGYLGAMMAGQTMARIAVSRGWHGAFAVLGIVSLLSTAISIPFLLAQMRRRSST